MNITPEMKRKPEESIDKYLVRLGSNLALFELNWPQATQLLNEESPDEYSESRWRKRYASYLEWKEFVCEEISDSDEYLGQIKDSTLDLKKERVKLQSEKLEYSKMLREDARNELLEEKIVDAVTNRPTIQVPHIIIKPNASKSDYIFPIADVHYAAEFQLRGWFDEILNEYSPDIAQKRMWNLLEQYVAQNDIDKINHAHLFNLGDSLDGILRMSQLQWIKLGNVDSAIEFAEFMSNWLNEFSKYSTLDYYSVGGNHTELRLLNGKRGDFAHENMEKIVSHIISCNLKGNPNINIHQCKNHMYVDILGTKVLSVHGHEERKLADSLTEYPKMFGHPVDLMLSGHLHHADEKTIGMNGIRDIEYVQCPSVVGIDDFSMKIKKTSNAGAKLMVIRENVGRFTTHNLKVN